MTIETDNGFKPRERKFIPVGVVRILANAEGVSSQQVLAGMVNMSPDTAEVMSRLSEKPLTYQTS